MTKIKKYLTMIGLGILGFIIIVVIFRSCFSSKKNNNDESTNRQKTEKGVTQAFSYTIPVYYGKTYGDTIFIPAGYDFSFIPKSSNEYCAKNKDSQACGVGDISTKLSFGAINTEGVQFKGEKEGSLEILLVKNNNL